MRHRRCRLPLLDSHCAGAAARGAPLDWHWIDFVIIGLILGFRPETGVFGIVGAILLLNVFGFGISWVFVVLGTPR